MRRLVFTVLAAAAGAALSAPAAAQVPAPAPAPAFPPTKLTNSEVLPQEHTGPSADRHDAQLHAGTRRPLLVLPRRA